MIAHLIRRSISHRHTHISATIPFPSRVFDNHIDAKHSHSKRTVRSCVYLFTSTSSSSLHQFVKRLVPISDLALLRVRNPAHDRSALLQRRIPEASVLRVDGRPQRWPLCGVRTAAVRFASALFVGGTFFGCGWKWFILVERTCIERQRLPTQCRAELQIESLQRLHERRIVTFAQRFAQFTGNVGRLIDQFSVALCAYEMMSKRNLVTDQRHTLILTALPA